MDELPLTSAGSQLLKEHQVHGRSPDQCRATLALDEAEDRRGCEVAEDLGGNVNSREEGRSLYLTVGSWGAEEPELEVVVDDAAGGCERHRHEHAQHAGKAEAGDQGNDDHQRR